MLSLIVNILIEPSVAFPSPPVFSLAINDRALLPKKTTRRKNTHFTANVCEFKDEGTKEKREAKYIYFGCC